MDSGTYETGAPTIPERPVSSRRGVSYRRSSMHHSAVHPSSPDSASSSPAQPPTAVATPLATSAAPLHADHPLVSELLLHPVKALQFVGGLLTDRRVSVVRKLLFVVPVLGLLFALLLPE